MNIENEAATVVADAKADLIKVEGIAIKDVNATLAAIHAHLIAAGAVLFVAGGVFAKLVL